MRKKITGTEIPNGGASNEADVIAEGTDDVEGTGIAKIIITQTAGGSFSSTAPFSNENVGEQTTFTGLGEGTCAVWAVDFMDSESALTSFMVDKTPSIAEARADVPCGIGGLELAQRAASLKAAAGR